MCLWAWTYNFFVLFRFLFEWLRFRFGEVFLSVLFETVFSRFFVFCFIFFRGFVIFFLRRFR